MAQEQGGRASTVRPFDLKLAELVTAQEEERALKARIARIMPQIAAARRERDAFVAQYAGEQASGRFDRAAPHAFVRAAPHAIVRVDPYVAG